MVTTLTTLQKFEALKAKLQGKPVPEYQEPPEHHAKRMSSVLWLRLIGQTDLSKLTSKQERDSYDALHAACLKAGPTRTDEVWQAWRDETQSTWDDALKDVLQRLAIQEQPA